MPLETVLHHKQKQGGKTEQKCHGLITKLQLIFSKKTTLATDHQNKWGKKRGYTIFSLTGMVPFIPF
jgi:hypothetical protein